MPRYVSAADANRQFSEILGQAADGETVIITRRGEPVAQLTPFDLPCRRGRSRGGLVAAAVYPGRRAAAGRRRFRSRQPLRALIRALHARHQCAGIRRRSRRGRAAPRRPRYRWPSARPGLCVDAPVAGRTLPHAHWAQTARGPIAGGRHSPAMARRLARCRRRRRLPNRCHGRRDTPWLVVLGRHDLGDRETSRLPSADLRETARPDGLSAG